LSPDPVENRTRGTCWIWGQVCKGIVGNQPTALLGQASSLRNGLLL